MSIKFDKRNYRKHSEKNKQIIKKSVDELGAGRSILTDANDEIIAGNGVYEQWGNRPIRVVETDGTELIVVKRNDLNTDDEKRKKLALLDNHASDTSEWDKILIKEDFGKEFLENIELNTNGYFQNTISNEEFDYDKIKWPITIVVDENDYLFWEDLKIKYNEKNDLKLFINCLNNVRNLEIE